MKNAAASKDRRVAPVSCSTHAFQHRFCYALRAFPPRRSCFPDTSQARVLAQLRRGLTYLLSGSSEARNWENVHFLGASSPELLVSSEAPPKNNEPFLFLQVSPAKLHQQLFPLLLDLRADANAPYVPIDWMDPANTEPLGISRGIVSQPRGSGFSGDPANGVDLGARCDAETCSKKRLRQLARERLQARVRGLGSRQFIAGNEDPSRICQPCDGPSSPWQKSF